MSVGRLLQELQDFSYNTSKDIALTNVPCQIFKKAIKSEKII